MQPPLFVATCWRAPHRWCPPPSVSEPPSELPAGHNCLHHVQEKIATGLPAWSTYEGEERIKFFTGNGVRNFYPKLLQLSCSECKIHAKRFTVSPKPRLSIPDFSSQLCRKFLQSCKIKFQMECLSLRLFCKLPITCFLQLKSAGTLD